MNISFPIKRKHNEMESDSTASTSSLPPNSVTGSPTPSLAMLVADTLGIIFSYLPANSMRSLMFALNRAEDSTSMEGYEITTRQLENREFREKILHIQRAALGSIQPAARIQSLKIIVKKLNEIGSTGNAKRTAAIQFLNHLISNDLADLPRADEELITFDRLKTQANMNAQIQAIKDYRLIEYRNRESAITNVLSKLEIADLRELENIPDLPIFAQRMVLRAICTKLHFQLELDDCRKLLESNEYDLIRIELGIMPQAVIDPPNSSLLFNTLLNDKGVVEAFNYILKITKPSYGCVRNYDIYEMNPFKFLFRRLSWKNKLEELFGFLENNPNSMLTTALISKKPDQSVMLNTFIPTQQGREFARTLRLLYGKDIMSPPGDHTIALWKIELSNALLNLDRINFGLNLFPYFLRNDQIISLVVFPMLHSFSGSQFRARNTIFPNVRVKREALNHFKKFSPRFMTPEEKRFFKMLLDLKKNSSSLEETGRLCLVKKATGELRINQLILDNSIKKIIDAMKLEGKTFDEIPDNILFQNPPHLNSVAADYAKLFWLHGFSEIISVAPKNPETYKIISSVLITLLRDNCLRFSLKNLPYFTNKPDCHLSVTVPCPIRDVDLFLICEYNRNFSHCSTLWTELLFRFINLKDYAGARRVLDEPTYHNGIRAAALSRLFPPGRPSFSSTLWQELFFFQ